jgi:hypothetical protein
MIYMGHGLWSVKMFRHKQGIFLNMVRYFFWGCRERGGGG